MSAGKIIGSIVVLFVVLAILFPKKSTDAVDEPKKETVNDVMQSIQEEAIQHELEKFDMALKAHDLETQVAEAGIIEYMYLDAKDQKNYEKWKARSEMLQQKQYNKMMREIEAKTPSYYY